MLGGGPEEGLAVVGVGVGECGQAEGLSKPCESRAPFPRPVSIARRGDNFPASSGQPPSPTGRDHPLTLTFTPCLVRSMVGPELQSLQLGDPLLDEYLAFVGARARRNTWLAVAFDLKVFFSVVGKPPADVRTPDVLGFLTNQRSPRHGSAVVRLADGEAGLAARTIARRMSSVRSLYD